MTDDQMAMWGCGAAVVVCTVIMMIATQIGKVVRRNTTSEDQPESIRLPERTQKRRAA